MSFIEIPPDAVGNKPVEGLFVNVVDYKLLAISQASQGKYQPQIRITLNQAEQLRDYLNDLFEVEK